jgi:hypothetical protein
MDTARAAVVEGGVVTNVILVEVDGSNQTGFEIPGSDLHILDESSMVSPGWTYDGEFHAPVEGV